ncbi:hypothetical protein BGX24_011604 [Mortierella sp. AD032]|nr:hypothetical protein BGX24_011604 [Mortierella sp. AD032]
MVLYFRHGHYQKLCSKSLPETLKGCVSEEQLHKAQAFGRDIARDSFAKAAFLLVLETLWSYNHLSFFQIKSIVEELIELPSELYRIFVVEERHGFNKQSWGLFMKDFVVMTLVRAIFEMPLYAGLIEVFKMGGANFYIHAWLFVNTVSRDYESLADAFACDLGYAASLSSGLMKLQLKNLGNMNPDWLYSMYHGNHPEIVERLDAIKQKTAILSKSNKAD